MLTPYRRHLKRCPHRSKGQHFNLCDCPVWVYGTDQKGKPVRAALFTTDWHRALERIQNWGLATAELTGSHDQPALLIHEATERFLADAARRQLAPSTVESYTLALDRLEAALPRHMRVTDLTVDTIDRFCQARPVGPRTAGKEIGILRAFLAFCQKRKWLTDNPARSVQKPKITDVATLPFTPEEVEKLIAATDIISSDDPFTTPYIRKRARAIVYTLLYSGLRISDVAVLRRAALDEPNRYLTVRITKTGVPIKIQLHPDAVEALVTLPAQNPEYFFWTGLGLPRVCAKSMWRTIQRLGELAGVEHAHPHRFRDTFAVELLTQGVKLDTVQVLLGHKSIMTTERHYVHFVKEHQQCLDTATAALNFQPKPGRPVLMKPLQHRGRNA